MISNSGASEISNLSVGELPFPTGRISKPSLAYHQRTLKSCCPERRALPPDNCDGTSSSAWPTGKRTASSQNGGSVQFHSHHPKGVDHKTPKRNPVKERKTSFVSLASCT